MCVVWPCLLYGKDVNRACVYVCLRACVRRACVRACMQAPELGKGGVTFVMGWKPNNNLLPILGAPRTTFTQVTGTNS
jgi:hypothetical protein